MLGALVLAHDRGILHRDVKPGNMLVAAGGAVKVTDFGIAKSAGATEHTATGMVLGTVAYLSPARLLGAPATAADDLWATGVLAWECLLGHRPFDGDNLLALARAISAHPTPPVSAAAPGVDPALAEVIDRLLARDPADHHHHHRLRHDDHRADPDQHRALAGRRERERQGRRQAGQGQRVSTAPTGTAPRRQAWPLALGRASVAVAGREGGHSVAVVMVVASSAAIPTITPQRASG